MLYSAKLTFCVAIAIQMCIICVWIFFYKRNFQMCGRHYGEIATLTKTEGRLTTCPLIPIGLVGSITVNKTDLQTWTTIEQKYSVIKDGGFVPENCTSRQRVAILVPFRDRESHLRIFLNHMHAFLMKQQLEYAIYVIEQRTWLLYQETAHLNLVIYMGMIKYKGSCVVANILNTQQSNIQFLLETEPFAKAKQQFQWAFESKDFEFNRGFLFNVGFKEALRDSRYDCFVLHDVDLLPENDHNIYTCPVDQPKHLSVILENWDYKLPYDANFGGVSAMTKEQYEAVNGFSNSFFGWGGEDDDIYNRVVWANMSIYRAITGVGRYSSLQHVTATENPARYKILSKGKEQMWKDGLSSLNYIIIQRKTKKLFNHIIVKTI